MGNASSDAMNHSFKRLRVSDTNNLPKLSPSTSPKRKTSNNLQKYPESKHSREMPVLVQSSSSSSWKPSDNYSLKTQYGSESTIDRDYVSLKPNLFPEKLLENFEKNTDVVSVNCGILSTNLVHNNNKTDLYMKSFTLELSDEEIIQVFEDAFGRKQESLE